MGSDDTKVAGKGLRCAIIQPLTGRAETMFSTDTYGVFGCLKHNRLYHKERGEWVQFTHLQMTAIRAIYTYCNLAFMVQQT